MAGFSQQGSLDWVNLANTTVNFSVGLLSRFAAAGVDPYTVKVGQAIARNLPLSVTGQRNVQNALSDLRSYGSLGNALWFGFGIKSFPRALGTTDEGRTLLAISAALSECFDEDFAADTLHNLVLAFRSESEPTPTPSRSEWLYFVRACTGMLSLTKFPHLVEVYTRLDPTPSGRSQPWSEDLARTIKAVGGLANGQMHSITIKCGASIGWIAAVSEWLFGLTVNIRDPQGTILYWNCLEPDEVQLQLWLQSDDPRQSTAFETISSTYHLRNGADFIAVGDRIELMKGRVDWSECLDTAFGSEFSRLLGIPVIFGTALGCAANMFEAIANGRWNGKDTEAYQSYFDAASGQDYITNALRWFPELASIERHTEDAVRMSHSDAMTCYELELGKVRKECGCVMCRRWPDSGAYSDNEKSKKESVGERYERAIGGNMGYRNFFNTRTVCLVALLETIITLCHIMAGLCVAKGLCPTSSGLRSFYNFQARRVWTRDRMSVSNYVSQWFYQGPDSARGTDIYWDHSNTRLVDALRLFTGQNIPEKTALATAFAEGGICVYFDIFRDFSLAPEDSGLIHVMPGSIERSGRLFRAVTDRVSLRNHPAPDMDLDLFNGPSLIVTETVHALQVHYLFTGKLSQSGKSFALGPGQIIQSVWMTRGRVRCDRYSCQPEPLLSETLLQDLKAQTLVTFKGEMVSCKEEVMREPTILLARRRGQSRDDYFRAVTLMSARAEEDDAGYSCFLMDVQCLDCCMRAAHDYFGSKNDTKNALIIISDYAHYIDKDSGQRVPLTPF